jgi:hypothetical protein
VVVRVDSSEVTELDFSPAIAFPVLGESSRCNRLLQIKGTVLRRVQVGSRFGSGVQVQEFPADERDTAELEEKANTVLKDAFSALKLDPSSYPLSEEARHALGSFTDTSVPRFSRENIWYMVELWRMRNQEWMAAKEHEFLVMEEAIFEDIKKKRGHEEATLTDVEEVDRQRAEQLDVAREDYEAVAKFVQLQHKELLETFIAAMDSQLYMASARKLIEGLQLS